MRPFSIFEKVPVFTLTSLITSIGMGAFANCSNLEMIYIPVSVTKIVKAVEELGFIGDIFGVFEGCEKIVINCYSGSYAKTYAKELNITYKLLDAHEPCWKQNTTGWWYDNGDGTYPKNEWEGIDGS